MLNYLGYYVFVQLFLFDLFVVKHLLVFKVKLEWCAVILILNNLAYLDSILILECLDKLLLITTSKVLFDLFLCRTWTNYIFGFGNALEAILV